MSAQDNVLLDVAMLSHPGMVRPHNEDSIFADSDYGLVILADGMGGYNAGEVASGIAVNVVSSGLLPPTIFKKPAAWTKVASPKPWTAFSSSRFLNGPCAVR